MRTQVWVAYYTQSTQNNKFTISLQYIKENVKDEIDFLPPDIHQGLLKLILSFYVYVARHVQITQNNKFAISLNYLKEEVSSEVHFLHAGK